jgi:hypothetical protein
MREQINFQWDDDEVRFVLDKHAEVDFYSASSLKQQSWVDMLLHSDTLFWFRANQYLLFLLNAACLARSNNKHINFIVFGLTRPRREPTIYHTRGKHADHYATDAVEIEWVPVKNETLKQKRWLQFSIVNFSFTVVYVATFQQHLHM